MKRLVNIVTMVVLSALSEVILHAEPETVDKILAIIYHPEGDIPITQSDLNSGFEGRKSLEDVIFDKHVELDGKVLKVTIAEEDINRHLAQVQKIYNLTKEDTIKYAKSMGLTYEQFHEELGKGLLRDQVIGYRTKSGSSNLKDEALAYYHANPIAKEAIYTIKQAFIPFGDNSPSLMKIRVQEAIDNGIINSAVQWSEPMELKEGQIATDKDFIKTLAPEKSAIANVTDTGISLIQLHSKEPSRLLTYEERETEIKNTLMRSKREKAFSDYKKKLYGTSSVKYIQ